MRRELTEALRLPRTLAELVAETGLPESVILAELEHALARQHVIETGLDRYRARRH